jgi:hypothetical protein
MAKICLRRLNLPFWLILIAALASGCASTLNYRDLQKDFNQAVQADNVHAVEGLGALTSSSLAGYEEVQSRLNEKYLQSLDPKLTLNAYAMKAVAQWRTGRLAAAKQTADTALARKDVPPSPRDTMVLLMIPALVNDQDIWDRYKKLPKPKRLSWNDYKEVYEPDFAGAAASLKEAASLAPPGMPEDMLNYVSYQRWRILAHWQNVISSLYDADSEKGNEMRNRARASAKSLLNGVELETELDTQKKAIPPGHWLRNYIEYLEKL